jgi:hypothetical protein
VKKYRRMIITKKEPSSNAEGMPLADDGSVLSSQTVSEMSYFTF